jgi:hypothetical protein
MTEIVWTAFCVVISLMTLACTALGIWAVLMYKKRKVSEVAVPELPRQPFYIFGPGSKCMLPQKGDLTILCLWEQRANDNCPQKNFLGMLPKNDTLFFESLLHGIDNKDNEEDVSEADVPNPLAHMI